MTSRYAESTLEIDPKRWYYTRFSVERYRQAVDWTEVKEKFDRTADAVRLLLKAYRSADVFGDAELTALKSTIQVSHTVGKETTQTQIQESRGTQAELDRAVELVEDGTGVVGGLAFHASVEEVSADTLFGIFETLLDEDAELEVVDEAAEELLSLDLGNIGGATLSPILCLLRPTRYPIVNQQSKSVFDTCFDIQLSASADDYLESAAKFWNVRDEFGFQDHLRQLDYFCYWLREVVGPDSSPLPENFADRKIWQINAGQSNHDEPTSLWPVWKDIGICSIGWDIGSLDGLSVSEMETAAEQWEGDEISDYFRRFGKEMQPGQLVIAKDGRELLGIGVTKRGGYHYCPEAINERVDDSRIDHVHAWPVDWQVIPASESDRDVGEWNLETGLQIRKTLVGTGAFEGIRSALAERDETLISPLADLEETIRDPPTASLPDDCQSQASPASDYFILQTGNEDWEDEPTSQYHFELGNPGTRQLWNSGTAQIVYLEDGQLYATARVKDIDREERDGDTHCFASIEGYEELNPVDLDDIWGQIESSKSRQHSIIKISESDYQAIVTEGNQSSYYWVNSESDDWHHAGGEAFYTNTTSGGTRRQNHTVYEEAQPGDEVLIYRNAPVQAIVGRGHVEEELHARASNEGDSPTEGITVSWDEELEGVDWSRLQSIPELEGSPVLESNNSYVITGLTEREYDTLLEVASGREQKSFWVTVDSDVWNLESAKPGDEVFYPAYNDAKNKRKFFDAFEQATSGDRLVFYRSSPVQQIVAEGTVVEGLHREQSAGRDELVEGVTFRYDESLVPVNWKTITSLDELEGSRVLRNNARGTLFLLSDAEFDAIRSAGDLTDRLTDLRSRLSPPDMNVDLPDGLYFEYEDELRRQIQASLNSGQHIIFTGPPGTGKTKLAKHICEHALAKHDVVDGHRFTTATAEWTTFDTVGGYVPNRAATGDELVFQPRIFLDCFRREGTIRNEWLVIDEINRSDIDKAFGQLFSVLSGDSVQLPYERESPIEIASLDESTDDERLMEVITDPDIFPVTPSWRLLATMNTYDKTSLYELSYAFMRRFNFIHVGVPPLVEEGDVRTSLLDPDGDENYATEWVKADESLREPLEEVFEQLAVVWHKVNKHQTIGPSIVQDMLEYLAATGLASLEDPGAALTDAVIALVFPQLEGMAPQNQRNLVDSLTESNVPTEAGPVDLTLERARLERKAEDFFDLPPRSDE